MEYQVGAAISRPEVVSVSSGVRSMMGEDGNILVGSMTANGSIAGEGSVISQDCVKSLLVDLNNIRDSGMAKESGKECIEMLIKQLQEGGFGMSIAESSSQIQHLIQLLQEKILSQLSIAESSSQLAVSQIQQLIQQLQERINSQLSLTQKSKQLVISQIQKLFQQLLAATSQVTAVQNFNQPMLNQIMTLLQQLQTGQMATAGTFNQPVLSQIMGLLQQLQTGQVVSGDGYMQPVLNQIMALLQQLQARGQQMPIELQVGGVTSPTPLAALY